MIRFTSPSYTKTEKKNVISVLEKKQLTDGFYQKKTEEILRQKLNSNFIGLTQSCSDALEVSSIIINLKPDDEVIIPSYTFSSTANAITLRGAKPTFVDVNKNNFCINLNEAEKFITKKTKAIFLVHYGGYSCDMDHAIYLKKKYNLFLVEDAAHAIFSKYKNKFLGTIGDIGTFSFHETKNLSAGQAGAISINNKKLISKTISVLDKGTNRRKAEKESLEFYDWITDGSEFRATEISSALVYSQLRRLNYIQGRRKKIYNFYYKYFLELKKKYNLFSILTSTENTKLSYHLFAVVFNTTELAKKFKKYLNKAGIQVLSHYTPLHLSPKGSKYKSSRCRITKKYYKNLVRFPLHSELTAKDILFISKKINSFFENNSDY